MKGPAFSTLACPDWPLETALTRGREYGYLGVELRLVDGELIEASMPEDERRRAGASLSASGLAVVAVDSSLCVTEEEPELVAGQIVRFVELAAGWGAPLIRVFGGAGDLDRAVRALRLAAREVESSGVAIGLETHDAFSSAAAVARVLDALDTPAIGAVWDIVHTLRKGEPPAEVVARLGDRILDVHIKDARRIAPGTSWDEGFRYVLLGEGEVPVKACLEALQLAGYDRWVVAEWEKRWHPEIQDPDVALPQHATVMRGWLDAIRPRPRAGR